MRHIHIVREKITAPSNRLKEDAESWVAHEKSLVGWPRLSIPRPPVIAIFRKRVEWGVYNTIQRQHIGRPS